jgi:hypothetical protein
MRQMLWWLLVGPAWQQRNARAWDARGSRAQGRAEGEPVRRTCECRSGVRSEGAPIRCRWMRLAPARKHAAK